MGKGAACAQPHCRAPCSPAGQHRPPLFLSRSISGPSSWTQRIRQGSWGRGAAGTCWHRRLSAAVASNAAWTSTAFLCSPGTCRLSKPSKGAGALRSTLEHKNLSLSQPAPVTKPWPSSSRPSAPSSETPLQPSLRGQPWLGGRRIVDRKGGILGAPSIPTFHATLSHGSWAGLLSGRMWPVPVVPMCHGPPAREWMGTLEPPFPTLSCAPGQSEERTPQLWAALESEPGLGPFHPVPQLATLPP